MEDPNPVRGPQALGPLSSPVGIRLGYEGARDPSPARTRLISFAVDAPHDFANTHGREDAFSSKVGRLVPDAEEAGRSGSFGLRI